MWIQEGITLEQLDGGLGPMSSKVVTRYYQFASDIAIVCDDSSKTCPSPLSTHSCGAPHTLLVIFYPCVNTMWLACLLNHSTVLCLVSLRELFAKWRLRSCVFSTTCLLLHFKPISTRLSSQRGLAFIVTLCFPSLKWTCQILPK